MALDLQDRRIGHIMLEWPLELNDLGLAVWTPLHDGQLTTRLTVIGISRSESMNLIERHSVARLLEGLPRKCSFHASSTWRIFVTLDGFFKFLFLAILK